MNGLDDVVLGSCCCQSLGNNNNNNNKNACKVSCWAARFYLHFGPPFQFSNVFSTPPPTVSLSEHCLFFFIFMARALWTLPDRSQHLWLNTIEFNHGNNNNIITITTTTILGNRKLQRQQKRQKENYNNCTERERELFDCGHGQMSCNDLKFTALHCIYWPRCQPFWGVPEPRR